jgi:SEC-C motif-containing protein
VDLTTTCPCGRNDARGRTLPYAACCGRWLDAATPAPDAESLMRSRYTAFVLERSDYLLASWHSSTRPQRVDFEPGVKWLGLEVRWQEQADAAHAQVEFVARQRGRTGSAIRLHERSRFVNEQGRWFYVDGDMLP